MASSTPTHRFDLVGVGAPIMDIVAPIPEDFLKTVQGEKGGMVMVSAEEMEAMVSRLPGSPQLTPGGSAANTTFNATRLGLRTTFVGKLGNDGLAKTYEDRFRINGVNTERYKRGTLPNARCLILTTPDAQRTMRTYLGSVMTLSPEEISPADFEGCRHAHIEGYVVFNQALANAILKSARAAGCTISLDLASFEVVRESRDWLLTQLKQGLDLVIANEDEIRALFSAGDDADYADMASRLARFGGTAVVKMGKDGAWIASGDRLLKVDPVKVDRVLDTNGAGDAWAAGFLAAWLKGHTLEICGKLGSLIGAETVQHFGPVIPDEAWTRVSAPAADLLNSPLAPPDQRHHRPSNVPFARF